jgi:hypothetical protein
MIVVDGDLDFPLANGFIIRIVELSDVRMLQSLLCCESLVGVELKHETKNVKCFFRSVTEKFRQSPRSRRRR